MHFTAINGVQPNIPENIEETIKEADNSSSEDNIRNVTITGKDIINTQKSFAEIQNKSAEQIKQYIGNQQSQTT